MQQDALQRLNLKRCCWSRKCWPTVEADVHLVATLISLEQRDSRPNEGDGADGGGRVVTRLLKKLAQPHARPSMGRSSSSAIPVARATARSTGTARSGRTCKHYQPPTARSFPRPASATAAAQRAARYRPVHRPERLDGHLGGLLRHLRRGTSRASRGEDAPGRLDTAVVDLTTELHDPVDLLFGTQLGGGTDIARALAYCQGLISRPADTILILISDLYEGGVSEACCSAGRLRRVGSASHRLARPERRGAASYDHANRQRMTDLGIPVFACTPDLFPDLMAAAINRQDITAWATRSGHRDDTWREAVKL